MQDKKFDTEKYSFDAPIELQEKITKIKKVIINDFDNWESSELKGEPLVFCTITEKKLDFSLIQTLDRSEDIKIPSHELPYYSKCKTTIDPIMGGETQPWFDYYKVFGRGQRDCLNVTISENGTKFSIYDSFIESAFNHKGVEPCSKEEFDSNYKKAIDHFNNNFVL